MMGAPTSDEQKEPSASLWLCDVDFHSRCGFHEAYVLPVDEHANSSSSNNDIPVAVLASPWLLTDNETSTHRFLRVPLAWRCRMCHRIEPERLWWQDWAAQEQERDNSSAQAVRQASLRRRPLTARQAAKKAARRRALLVAPLCTRCLLCPRCSMSLEGLRSAYGLRIELTSTMQYDAYCPHCLWRSAASFATMPRLTQYLLEMHLARHASLRNWRSGQRELGDCVRRTLGIDATTTKDNNNEVRDVYDASRRAWAVYAQRRVLHTKGEQSHIWATREAEEEGKSALETLTKEERARVTEIMRDTKDHDSKCADVISSGLTQAHPTLLLERLRDVFTVHDRQNSNRGKRQLPTGVIALPVQQQEEVKEEDTTHIKEIDMSTVVDASSLRRNEREMYEASQLAQAGRHMATTSTGDNDDAMQRPTYYLQHPMKELITGLAFYYTDCARTPLYLLDCDENDDAALQPILHALTHVTSDEAPPTTTTSNSVPRLVPVKLGATRCLPFVQCSAVSPEAALLSLRFINLGVHDVYIERIRLVRSNMTSGNVSLCMRDVPEAARIVCEARKVDKENDNTHRGVVRLCSRHSAAELQLAGLADVPQQDTSETISRASLCTVRELHVDLVRSDDESNVHDAPQNSCLMVWLRVTVFTYVNDVGPHEAGAYRRVTYGLCCTAPVTQRV